jgi:hypothetical protein
MLHEVIVRWEYKFICFILLCYASDTVLVPSVRFEARYTVNKVV